MNATTINGQKVKVLDHFITGHREGVRISNR
jgi:hypothetical protein